MKKKLISMLLAGAMVLSLAACGGGGGNANGGSGDSGDGGSAQTEGTDELCYKRGTRTSRRLHRES